ANLDAHALLVADRNADHGAAIDSRRLDLIGRLEVRIEPAISIHAGIQQKANIVAMGEDAIDEGPSRLAELLFALGVPEQVLAVFADRNVGVHAAAVDADDRFRQERCGQAHVGSDLAADQLVELDLVGGGYDLTKTVVDFKLRGRDLRMVFLVLEA